MNIDEKLERFSRSLEETSNREYKQIETELENEINSAIEQEINEYETKKQLNYEKTMQRIEKDYNKKVYNYEISSKKQIIDEEKKLKDKLKNEAILKLKEFTKNDNYKDFLLKSIELGISKIETYNATCIGITKEDIEKYRLLISEKYGSNIKEIDSKYIGGCILENNDRGIFIDNTLLNMVGEKMEG